MRNKLRSAIKAINYGSITTAAVLGMAAPAFAQDAGPIEEVTVTGIRGSLINNIEAKRMSNQIVEVVTAEDIGKMPDKNIADTIQRIPGVAVTTGSASAGGFGENEKVSIRGTDPNLNLTTINGHSVGTGDWFVLDQSATIGRSFSYSMLPSELIGRVDIYKSQKADLVEGGIGGTVDVHTRNPLDLDAHTFMGSVEGVYAELPGKTSPQVSGLYSYKNYDETFGALVQVFSQETEIRRDGVENILFHEKADVAGDGTDTAGTHAGLIGLSYFRQTRNRTGAFVGLQFRPTDQLEFNLTGLQSEMSADNINSNFMIWQQTGSGVLQGGPRQATPTEYEVDDSGYLVSASFPSINDAGGLTEAVVQDDIFRAASSSTSFIDLEATYELSDTKRITAQIGTTEGVGETSFTPAFESLYWTGASYDQRTNEYDYRDLDSNPLENTDTHYSWSWGGTYESLDKENYGQVDFEMDFDGVVSGFKTGVRSATHERVVNSKTYQFAGNYESGSDYITVDANGDGEINAADSPLSMQFVSRGETTPSNYLDGLGVKMTVNDGAEAMNGYPLSDFGMVEDLVRSYCVHGPDGSTTVDITRTNLAGESTTAPGTFCGITEAKGYTSDFEVTETTTAAYAMADLTGDNWRGNVGLRVIKTTVDSVNWSDTPNSDTPDIVYEGMGTDWAGSYSLTERAAYEYKFEGDYVNVLPSMSLAFDLNDDLVARVAAAKTLARPGYRSIGGGVALNTNNQTGTAGNPSLKPIEAAAYSSTLEWYYDEGAVLSAEVFYLDFANFVETGTQSIDVYVQDINYPDGEFVQFDLATPVNGDGGSNQGLALSVQHPFANTGFGVIANYTYTEAELDSGAPQTGVSENIFNATGYYENDNFSIRIAHNYRSDIYTGLDFNSVPMAQKAYGQWDLSANYDINDNVALSFSWLNMTGETMEYIKETAPAKGTTINKYDVGGRFYAGVRVKF